MGVTGAGGRRRGGPSLSGALASLGRRRRVLLPQKGVQHTGTLFPRKKRAARRAEAAVASGARPPLGVLTSQGRGSRGGGGERDVAGDAPRLSSATHPCRGGVELVVDRGVGWPLRWGESSEGPWLALPSRRRGEEEAYSLLPYSFQHEAYSLIAYSFQVLQVQVLQEYKYYSTSTTRVQVLQEYTYYSYKY